MVNGEDSLTYTKNMITYGVPGTRKSFIGEILVLYCIALGLRTISTALMGVKAIFFGGIHLHKLFCLPNSNNYMPVFQSAKYGIQQIQRSTTNIMLY